MAGTKNKVSVGGDMIASAVAGKIDSFTVSHFSVGQSEQEKQIQLETIQKLINLLEATDELNTETRKTSLRHFENAKEELTSAEPDASEVTKYLNKASSFMDALNKAGDLYKKAAIFLSGLGLGG